MGYNIIRGITFALALIKIKNNFLLDRFLSYYYYHSIFSFFAILVEGIFTLQNMDSRNERVSQRVNGRGSGVIAMKEKECSVGKEECM